MTRVLARAFPDAHVTGLERYGEGLAAARRRTGCDFIEGDIYDCPFQGRADLVGMFDVLEHLHDDAAA